jgi:hypothetical protein
MADWEIVGELVSGKDYERLLRTWTDQPKHCKCGAKLAKLQVKCRECVQRSKREHDREYRKKRREMVID